MLKKYTFVQIILNILKHNMNKMKLSLIGAGPGDPELITLKAIRILKDADAILYDALVNEAILQYASPGTVIKFVGKRYGCHALSQEAINEHIVDYARKFGHVIRLKGGDPFVFGRAQEEIDAALSAGIEVEVVPGISSAIAVPANQKIPLTCRGINESFWVTTGTTKSGEISKDIQLAAQSEATVVILMAMSKLETIMQIFSDAGKSKTPVAIIQEGTTDNEKIVIGTVSSVSAKARMNGLKNPAIIVVGEVVNLHPSIMMKKVKPAISYQLRNVV